MRKPVLSALGTTVVGAGLALLSVLAGFWWLRTDGRDTTIEYVEIEHIGVEGPYSSSLSFTLDPNWTDVLVPAAVGGAVVGLLVGWLLPRLGRRLGSLLVGSAVLGAALGLIGVVAAYGWHRHETSGDDFARRYVDYLPFPSASDWTGLLLPAAVTGAVLGLVVGAVAYASVRRSARRAARSS